MFTDGVTTFLSFDRIKITDGGQPSKTIARIYLNFNQFGKNPGGWQPIHTN